MTTSEVLPLLLVGSSLVPGLVIFLLSEEQHRARTTLNVAAALTKLALTTVLAWGVVEGQSYETRIPFLPDADLLLRVDALSLLFVALSALLWLATTIYAVGYLEGSPHRSRFFGFFSICVASTMGIALAGNLVTFFVSYELLTLSTYPLVVHRGTPDSVDAGDVYLRYTLGGGAVLLAGVAGLHALAGGIEFSEGGALDHVDPSAHRAALIVLFATLVAGLAVKTAMVPLHGWLPRAMVAPAPVSALLHAVAVVKAGAFGITRVVYDVYGVGLASALGVMRWLAYAAGATILYGSIQALRQDDLKKRLAYSTVSQVSYIVLGVALLGTLSTVGGLTHLVHQGLMKITMFFCAGNLAETIGVHRVSELRGVGRRMPWTMGAFSVAALGMIGVPPLAGFVSKWHLGLGALEADAPWALAVLLASSLLNAAYFLPILHAAWWKEPDEPWPPARSGREAPRSLVWPAIATAVLSILVGLFADSRLSPLGWVQLIAEREFR